MAKTITIDLSDAQEKALNFAMVDIGEWVRNAVASKLQKCRQKIVLSGLTKQLNEKGERVLADEDISYFAGKIGFVSNLKSIPDDLQLEIVQKSNICSALERETLHKKQEE